MCLLHRHLCECCRFVYLPAPFLTHYNHICHAHYLPVTTDHDRDGGGYAHGSGRRILPTSCCRTYIRFEAKGLCCYCLEVCVPRDSPQHDVIHERTNRLLEDVGWVVRFAHEVPQWDHPPYQAQELFRLQYFYQEHHLKARHFQSNLHRRLLDLALAAP